MEYPLLPEGITLPRSMATLVLLLGSLLVQFTLKRFLRKHAVEETRRRLMVSSRNLILLSALLGLVLIWGEELRTLAVSLVAFVAAITIAGKELILSLLGGLYRMVTGAYAVGDRVEVGQFRGDVVDDSLLATQLLEVGPGPNSHQYTGRVVTLPNALLLTQAVVNESPAQSFVLHVLRIPLAASEDVGEAEQALLAAAREEVEPWRERAKAYLTKISTSRGLTPPEMDPRIILQCPEPGRVDMVLRFAAPTRHKGSVEQAILRRYLYRNRS